MEIYKNKNIIENQITNDFYSVVNPLVRDGLRVINKDQHFVLSQIGDVVPLDILEKKTGFDKNSLINFCMMLKEQNILSFSNDFLTVANDNLKTTSFTLWVHTTNNCCLRCSYCNIHTLGENSKMSQKTIKQLSYKIEETVKNNSLKRVYLRLAGGEPLLQWKDWINPMRDLKNRLINIGCSLKIILLSNLVLLTDELIEWIKQDNIGISVSFDGIGRYQDKSRHFIDGTGSFNVVTKNLDKLLKNNIYPTILTVISNNNIDGLPELTRFLINKNLNFRYSFVQFEDLNIENAVEKLKECLLLLSKSIDKGYQFTQKFNLCNLKFLNPYVQTCSNGLSGAAVYVDGSIYFCHTHFGFQPKIGSIFDTKDLISIFRGGNYYNKEKTAKECKQCNLRYVCSSGCPMVRKNGKDPHCMAYKELVPIIYKLIGRERLYRILNMNV